MKYLSLVLLSVLFVVSHANAGSIDPVKVAKKKQTPQQLYLTPRETFEMMSEQKGAVLFVDVRTPSELEFVGVSTLIDANIPYMLNDFSEWDAKKNRYKKVPNSDFAVSMKDKLVEKGLQKDAKIVLICRSGSRSAKAANLLNQLGYKNVYSVVEGFEGDKSKSTPTKGQRAVNGWKNAGLPWSYKLSESKSYFTDI